MGRGWWEGRGQFGWEGGSSSCFSLFSTNTRLIRSRTDRANPCILFGAVKPAARERKGADTFVFLQDLQHRLEHFLSEPHSFLFSVVHQSHSNIHHVIVNSFHFLHEESSDKDPETCRWAEECLNVPTMALPKRQDCGLNVINTDTHTHIGLAMACPVCSRIHINEW